MLKAVDLYLANRMFSICFSHIWFLNSNHLLVHIDLSGFWVALNRILSNRCFLGCFGSMYCSVCAWVVALDL